MIAIAWAALIIWPIVSVILYRNLPHAQAFCATMLGGYLLLPSGVGLDLPVLPTLDKTTVPVLSALVLSAIALRRERQTLPVLPGWIPRDKVTRVLLFMLVAGVVGTTFTNSQPIFYELRTLKGLAVYDAFSALLEILMLLLPLFLARRILASVSAQKVLVVGVAISALAYSFPTLWEVRMSPQLHSQIYGFFPHSFVQHIRQSGYRPLVFFDHGLSLSMYLALATIIAAGLIRIYQEENRAFWIMATVWLTMTLILSKSIGPLLLAIVIIPVVLLTRPRTQLVFAACLAGIVLSYPVLRSAQLIPLDRIMTVVTNINPERGQSLGVRFTNEEQLLGKALAQPVFGWGGWGRARVYNEYGRDISVTDGAWVGELSVGGWVRYIAIFGLLCWPIFSLLLTGRHQIDRISALLALILATKLIDLLPNSGLIPLIWMAAGALLGRLEMTQGKAETEQIVDETRTAATKGLRYARALSEDAPTEVSASGSDPVQPDQKASPYTRFRTIMRYHR